MIDLRNNSAKRRELVTQTRISEALERTMSKHMRNVLNEISSDAKKAYVAGGLKSSISAAKRGEVQVLSSLNIGIARAIGVSAARVSQFMTGKSAALFLEAKKISAADSGDDLLSEEELTAIIKKYAKKYAGEKATLITETTVARIQSAVAAGVADGLGPSAIAQMIEDKTGGTISGYRAEMIARTETHAAMSYGSIEAAGATGVVTTKTWLSAVDARTREDHADMDGQEVGIDEPFTGAASGMMYPGDPSGPADQVINCRCGLIYGTGD